MGPGGLAVVPAQIPLVPGMKTKTMGLDYPTAALIGYIIPLVAIIVAATEPKEPQRRWIRFHAFQALFLSISAGIVIRVVGTALMMIADVLGVVAGLLWLAYLIGIVMLGLKAKNGETPKVPLLGDQAEKLA